MLSLSKSEKRELRMLASEAYKVELAKELEKLEADFMFWHKGDISALDLDDRIQEYYSGSRKQLYNFYQTQNQPEAVVARAVALDLIARDRLSSEVGEKIGHLIQFFKGNA